jgi:hypothetical protein
MSRDTRRRMTARLPSKDHINSGENQFHLRAWQLAYPVDEKILIQGHNLGNIRH